MDDPAQELDAFFGVSAAPKRRRTRVKSPDLDPELENVYRYRLASIAQDYALRLTHTDAGYTFTDAMTGTTVFPTNVRAVDLFVAEDWFVGRYLPRHQPVVQHTPTPHAIIAPNHRLINEYTGCPIDMRYTYGWWSEWDAENTTRVFSIGTYDLSAEYRGERIGSFLHEGKQRTPGVPKRKGRPYVSWRDA